MNSRSPLSDLSEYEIRYLSSHLLATKQYETLHALLALETDNANNAWFEAKVGIGDGAAYMSDIRSARDGVEERDRLSIKQKRSAEGIALQVRYCLIETILAEIADQSSAMVHAFVRNGLWTVDEGIGYSSEINSWHSQIRTFANLALVAAENNRKICINRTFELMTEGPNRFFSRTSVSTAPLSDWSISDYALCAECLTMLAAALPREMLSRAVQAGQEIGNDFWRIYGLCAICPFLEPKNRRLLVKELWEEASELRLRFLKSEAFARLAPLFDEPRRMARIREAFREALGTLGDREARRILWMEPRSGILTLIHDVQKQLIEEVRALRQITPHVNLIQLHEALSEIETMDGLASHEAWLILLPELAVKGEAQAALAQAQRIRHPVYRNLIKAAIAGKLGKKRKEHILTEVCVELAKLDEPEVRCVCLATMSVHLDEPKRLEVLRKIVRDVRELEESLRCDVLQLVGQGLAACVPSEESNAIVAEAYGIAKDLGGLAGDGAVAILVPLLSVSSIEQEFSNIRRIRFNMSLKALKEEWSKETSKHTDRVIGLDGQSVSGVVRDALNVADTLAEYERSHLVAVLAPLVPPECWQVAVSVARSITGQYLKMSALLALRQHASASMKPALAVETIQTIWSVPGGIKRARALLEDLVTDTHTCEADLYEAWTSFLRSLARESCHVMLKYLGPNRSIVNALGGMKSVQQTLASFRTIERWWGRSPNDVKEDSDNDDGDSDRFQQQTAKPSSPAEAIGVAIGLFVDGQQFEHAKRLLASFKMTLGSAIMRNPYVELTNNKIFSGLSKAGRLDEAMQMLPEMATVPIETLEILFRQLISYGRSVEALRIFESVRAVSDSETAMLLASLLVEMYLAEDQLSAALALFKQVPFPRQTSMSLYAYTDMLFMLGNSLLKRKEWDRAKELVKALNHAADPLRAVVAARLAKYSASLSDVARVNFWQRVIADIDSPRQSQQ
jgi:hypothetical protein